MLTALEIARPPNAPVGAHFVRPHPDHEGIFVVCRVPRPDVPTLCGVEFLAATEGYTDESECARQYETQEIARSIAGMLNRF